MIGAEVERFNCSIVISIELISMIYYNHLLRCMYVWQQNLCIRWQLFPYWLKFSSEILTLLIRYTYFYYSMFFENQAI